jgi:hypothetical protein
MSTRRQGTTRKSTGGMAPRQLALPVSKKKKYFLTKL